MCTFQNTICNTVRYSTIENHFYQSPDEGSSRISEMKVKHIALVCVLSHCHFDRRIFSKENTMLSLSLSRAQTNFEFAPQSCPPNSGVFPGVCWETLTFSFDSKGRTWSMSPDAFSSNTNNSVISNVSGWTTLHAGADYWPGWLAPGHSGAVDEDLRYTGWSDWLAMWR